MIRRWTVLAVVVVAVGVGSYAGSRAYVGTMGSASAPNPALAALEIRLELSNSQRDAVSQVDSRFAAERVTLRQAVWAARDELLSIIQKPSSSRRQAVLAAERLGRAQKAMQVNSIEYIYEMRSLLTDSQKQQLSEIVGKGMCGLGGGGFGGGRRWRGGRGGRGGNGFCQD